MSIRSLLATVSILAFTGCADIKEIRAQVTPAFQVEAPIAEPIEPTDTGPWTGLNAKLKIVYGDYDDDTLCIAINVYHEARGSTRADQRGVINVVKTRVKDQQASPCQIVWAKAQFSWTRDGKSDYPKDRGAFVAALALAQSNFKDNTNHANHYHNISVTPAWAEGVADKKIIGSHVYMRI